MSLLYGDASREAMSVLSAQGFPEWNQPSAVVQLPKDISSVDSEILADLFSRLTAWMNYAGQQLAAAQVDEAIMEKKRELAYAKLMATMEKAKNERVAVLKAQANNDPYLEQLDSMLTKAFAYRKMLEAVYNNYDREITLISREITRRTNDQRALRKDRFTT